MVADGENPQAMVQTANSTRKDVDARYDEKI